MLTITRHADPGEHGDVMLTLSYELRSKTRLRTRSADGEDVAIFLPAGSPPLADGDRLQANDGRVVRVCAQPEALLHVSAINPRELNRAAYHLGNRHVPVQVGEGWLRLGADSVLQGMLEQLGMLVQPLLAPFQPESGAYGGGHHHSHGKDSAFQYAPRLHQFRRDGSPDDGT